MQTPTCTGMRVRSTKDAHVIFQAVNLGIRPMVTRRLDTEERRAITSGCVFVWEERSPNSEVSGVGLERWTEARRWGPSRVRDEFLFYHEKDSEPMDFDSRHEGRGYHSHTGSPPMHGSGSRPPHFSSNVPHRGPPGMVLNVGPLIKQTYSVFVETSSGRRKWHLIAYFTQETVHQLRTVEDFADIASIQVPAGVYRSARVSKGRAREDRLPSETSAAPTPQNQITVSNSATASNRTSLILPVQQQSPSSAQAVPTQRPHYQNLAPLAYLQNIPPPRRHPLDERALMSFFTQLS